MRVGIYGRVSTRDGGQETENQLIQLREFASKQGWEVACQYVDEASGTKADRQAFKQLFEDASQRKFDLVLFWSLHRFSREGALQTLQHLERLTGYGVGFRSYTELYLDSCGMFRDAVISILAVIAKQERARIVERVQAGIQRHKRDAAQGKISSRSGKNLKIGRPKLVFDRARVQQLRDEGRSIREVAALLKLSRATVARCLKNPSKNSANAA